MGGYHSVDTGPLLIEEWLPLQELGIEARRENSTGQHPPPNRLHVWWARRPLVVSRAAVLASLLPAWRPDWPEPLRRGFPTRDAYHAWVRRLLGIHGDPVAARQRIAEADARGERLAGSAFGYGRAFTYSPTEEELAELVELLARHWGANHLHVLDPMAGGGSIPLEALRLGLTVEANELNPVAAVILAATLDYPARFGEVLAEDIRQWGNRLIAALEPPLQMVYPAEPGGLVHAYLWARTVACPQTGKPIPLSPNWWLQRDDRGRVAVRLLVDPAWPACRFEIVSGPAAERAAEQGTIRRGVAVSPWTGEVVDGDYIKREAQAGRMGQQLYAVVVKTPKGVEFRTPTEADLAAAAAAEAELARRLPGWLARGLVPDEEIPEVSNYNRGHRLYGMTRWRDLFAPRQLLALGTAVEALRALEPEIQAELPPDRARAVVTYLALAIDKLADYNSRMSLLDVTRVAVKHTFDRHDFSMKWSYAEMAVVAAGKGLDWAINQVVDAYRGIARLAQPARLPLWQRAGGSPVERLRVTQGDARRLAHLPDGSIHLVCIDPPYYDNVQYAELSDFFYVWLKRTLGHHYPEWFATPLASKEDEAVANPARFAGLGRRARELARQDYERKMAAAFRECGRLLRPDGVLTVMFTHKQVDAWDALATALIDAGFQIVASWPVHTESEHSLHQARKNAARSTILLVCRKRPPGDGPVWWDDLRGELSRRVRARAQELAAQGVGGVDLFLAAYGPALSVISARWPVLTSTTDPTTGKPLVLRPETALDLARREVLALRRERLLHGQRARFDPETDWYLLAWDTFRAVEFPADEARKLALAVGLDLEEDVIGRARLVRREGDTVALLTPAERRRRGAVDPDAASFARLVDAVHTALLVYDEDGAPACGAFLRRAGLLQHPEFRQCLQALLEAVPRTRGRDGAFLRPEADLLERLRMAFFPELEPPAEPEPEAAVLQLGLLDGEAAEAGEEDEE
jgi:putative DNA methylase